VSSLRKLFAPLLGAVVLVLTLGAFGVQAVPASAASCTGSNVFGQGPFQADIQKSWISQFESTTCSKPGHPTVSFETSGTGAALQQWNSNGVRGSLNHAVDFLATDGAPNATQIANINGVAGGTEVSVIPVAQTSIAVVVNPPTGCEIEEITNQQLEAVFRGTVKAWGKIETAFGEGCTGAPITRVVRADNAGTTRQFKNYLGLINSAAIPCTEGEKTWQELEGPASAAEEHDTEWPLNGVAGCSSSLLSSLVPASRGPGEVEAVNATEGTIGYAALPDVEDYKGVSGEFANPHGDTSSLRLQNNGTVKLANANFATAGNSGSGTANCSAAQYTVPAAARTGSGTRESADWSQVFGAKLNVGGENYPLCALTYDLGFRDYFTAGFGQPVGTTMNDYLNDYVLQNPGGQISSSFKNTFYTRLPTGGMEATEVLGAARKAATVTETRCIGEGIAGEGPFQAGPQAVWRAQFEGTLCAELGHPTVAFEESATVPTMKEWNADGSRGSINHSLDFLSTDAPPTAAQIANIKSGASEAPLAVVPVAQTAIAVVVNPPTGCEVEKITNNQLESIFRGTLRKWNKIETAVGSGCEGAPITRVVRAENSGTTGQFKLYLSKVNSSPVACTEANKTWTQLDGIGSLAENPSTEWPTNGVEGCSATQVNPLVTAAGGSAEVEAVNTTEGSIGYAALPDVETYKGIAGKSANPNGDTSAVLLQNNGTVRVGATFASPVDAANATANCSEVQYQVPANGRAGSGSGQDVDWSQVFGGKTAIGGESYPLCALTYDIGFRFYLNAGFSLAIATTVRNYLSEYILQGGGQKALEGTYFAPLPSSSSGLTDVLGAARLAAPVE
jgi:ABC-type phosphate transport system substrate-binding protein